MTGILDHTFYNTYMAKMKDIIMSKDLLCLSFAMINNNYHH